MHKHYSTTKEMNIRNILRTFYSKPRLVSAVKNMKYTFVKLLMLAMNVDDLWLNYKYVDVWVIHWSYMWIILSNKVSYKLHSINMPLIFFRNDPVLGNKSHEFNPVWAMTLFYNIYHSLLMFAFVDFELSLTCLWMGEIIKCSLLHAEKATSLI